MFGIIKVWEKSTIQNLKIHKYTVSVLKQFGFSYFMDMDIVKGFILVLIKFYVIRLRFLISQE